MVSRGSRFLATIRERRETWDDGSDLEEPEDPQQEAERLLRQRLLRARERGSRWRQKKRKKAPEEPRPSSAALHRAYRAPAPAPPPNSPRCSLLGLPLPLEGAAVINPQWPLAARRPVRAKEQEQEFDSDGFRGDASVGAPEGSDGKSQVGEGEGEGGSRVLGGRVSASFFDMVLETVRVEVKRRAMLTQYAASTAARRRTAIAKQKRRNARSPERTFVMSGGRKKFGSDISFENEKQSESLSEEAENKRKLPPVIVKKDETITNYLRSSSPKKSSSSELPVSLDCQKIKISENRDTHPLIDKKQQIGKEKLLEKLTEGGIPFSSVFNVGKIKSSKYSIITTRSDASSVAPPTHTLGCENRNLNSPFIHDKNMCEQNIMKLHTTSAGGFTTDFDSKSNLKPSGFTSNSIQNAYKQSNSKGPKRRAKNNYFNTVPPQLREKSVTESGDADRSIFESNTTNLKNFSSLVKEKTFTLNQPGRAVDVKEEIERNIALSEEIDMCLAKAFASNNTHSPINNQCNKTNANIPKNIKTSGTFLLKSKQDYTNIETIKKTKTALKPPPSHNSIFGLMKQIVNMKRSQSLNA